MIEARQYSPEKVLLVSVYIKGSKKLDAIESLQELEFLALSAGADVKEKIMQVRSNIDAKFYLGKGKLAELNDIIIDKQIDTIIFDNELSPIQVRNIEGITNCKILGRVELILDIFARRARTREARLQVEYAQLTYLMPRLIHRWQHLGRIEGGIGFKGPGETQLEIDKRKIKKRISKIKEELKKMSVQMNNRRKKREGQKIVSIVGYTNSGKSTLLNLLAKDDVFTEDMLFATLDSTVRKVFINDNLKILLVDTVGFIRNLPHQLIVSFKSTLDEIKQSDLLLHVIDTTQENIYDRINSVYRVLDELSVASKPMIYVFNKIDKEDEIAIPKNILKEKYPQSCFISAKNGDGIDHLKDIISKFYNHKVDNQINIIRLNSEEN